MKMLLKVTEILREAHEALALADAQAPVVQEAFPHLAGTAYAGGTVVCVSPEKLRAHNLIDDASAMVRRYRLQAKLTLEQAALIKRYGP